MYIQVLVSSNEPIVKNTCIMHIYKLYIMHIHVHVHVLYNEYMYIGCSRPTRNVPVLLTGGQK